MIRRHTKECLAVVCLLTLFITGGPAGAVILDGNSFAAIRPLIGPDNGSPLEDSFPEAAGINGKGDVFGDANSVRGHHQLPFGLDRNSCHCEDPVVWKRSDGYEGKVVFGGLRSFVPGIAFNLSTDFAAVLDGAEAHPEQTKVCPPPAALGSCGLTFVVPQSIRTEFENNNLPLAENAVLAQLRVGKEQEYTPGGPWNISSPEAPDGCRNTGRFCEQQNFGITDLGEKIQELQVINRSPTHVRGVHVGRNRNTGATRRVVGVSEDGFVGGSSHQDNSSTFGYDMNKDVFTNFHGGMGMSANNNGIVVSSYDDYSEAPPAFVAHPDAISEENPEGWIHEFEKPLRLWHINDANEIVGTFEDNPIRIRPSGTDADGFPTYDAFNPATDILAETGPAFANSEAYAISSSDPAFIAGQSFSFVNFGPSGVVWGEDGNVLVEFGGGKIPSGITNDGTIAYGSIKDVFGATEQAAMWMTDDGWQSFTELILDDLLEDLVELGVEGSELVDSFTGNLNFCCWVSGMNNHGQAVVTGMAPDLGTLGQVRITEKAPLFLLDTLVLDTGGVLKGDVNNDGIVDFLDITPFINAQSAEGEEDAFLLLTPGGCFLCADIDMDGAIDFLDITPFVNLLDAVGGAVPEPASGMLLLVMGLVVARRTHR